MRNIKPGQEALEPEELLHPAVAVNLDTVQVKFRDALLVLRPAACQSGAHSSDLFHKTYMINVGTRSREASNTAHDSEAPGRCMSRIPFVAGASIVGQLKNRSVLGAESHPGLESRDCTADALLEDSSKSRGPALEHCRDIQIVAPPPLPLARPPPRQALSAQATPSSII